MFGRFAKLALIATSLAPVLFTLAFVHFRSGNFIPWGASLIAMAFLLAFICWALLRAARSQLEVLPLRMESVASADKEVIGYWLAYVLPLFLSTSSINVDYMSVVFVVFLFGFVALGTHSYSFNPLMGLLGFHFYQVSNSQGVAYVLISRKLIVNLVDVRNVVQIAEYVLLDRD